MYVNRIKFLELPVLKCKQIFMSRRLISGLNNCTSITNSGYSQEMLTTGYVMNHNEWLILLNYLKYLVKHPKECKFDRCVNILINIGDRILQYNKKWNVPSAHTTKWEWNRGILRQIDPGTITHQVTEDFGPSSLLNLLRILSNLRLFYIINNYKFKKVTINQTKVSTNKPKSYEFFNDLIDDIDPKSFKFSNLNFKANKIGPLRYGNNQLIAYPKFLSNPFYFELTDASVLNELEAIGSNGKNVTVSVQNKFSYFINSVMAQFLDQLFILISNKNISESKLCILSMYLSVMVYGPKLRNRTVCKIDHRVEKSLYKIFDHICRAVRLSGNELSIRSLAYLINSCKHRPGLMKYVANKLIGHRGTIGEHYLENFCFSFSRCYYEDEALYRKLASMVNKQAPALSPVVTANIIFSFFRIGKLELVKAKLFERFLAFTDEELDKCSQNVLQSMGKLLKEHQELEHVLSRINNVVIKYITC